MKDLHTLQIPPYVDPRSQHDIDSLEQQIWRARVQRRVESKSVKVISADADFLPPFIAQTGWSA